MAVDPLNRRMSFVAAFCAFVGVILGVVALSTNYWTMQYYVMPSTGMETFNGTFLTSGNFNWTWNGLFYQCTTFGCSYHFWAPTFIMCLLGVIFLFVCGMFICWDIFQISDRRFFIPLCCFVACVLLTAGLFDYGSMAYLNSHSSRTMIACICFTYAVLPMSAFIAGRYSAFDRFVGNGHVTNGQKYVPASTNGN